MRTYSSHRLAIPAPRALGLAIALAFSAAPALAQDASVYVSSFRYETSTGEELTWSSPFEAFQATALRGGGDFGEETVSVEQDNYFPLIGSTADGSVTYSTAGDQTFYLTATTKPSVGPQGTQPNQGTSFGRQSGMFSLAEAATVTFFVDYILGVSKPGGNALTDFATTSLFFTAGSLTVLAAERTDQLKSFNQLAGVGTKNGTFSISFALQGDQVGFYRIDGLAESFAVASIPEPQEWALMLAGFLGLGAYVRKRKAALA